MKKKIDETEKIIDVEVGKITRKEALKKAGYFAISATTTMILLSSPKKAHASSPDPPP